MKRETDQPTRRQAGTMRKHAQIKRPAYREAFDAARLAQALYERRVPVQLLMKEVARCPATAKPTWT